MEERKGGGGRDVGGRQTYQEPSKTEVPWKTPTYEGGCEAWTCQRVTGKVLQDLGCDQEETRETLKNEGENGARSVKRYVVGPTGNFYFVWTGPVRGGVLWGPERYRKSYCRFQERS